MKNRIKIILILLVITCLLYNFRFEIIFFNTKIGLKSSENRKGWGKPTYVGGDEYTFIDIYKDYPLNKYVFIFSKKDSTLVKKWKEN